MEGRDVLDRLRSLVAAGEYLDSVPGQPMEVDEATLEILRRTPGPLRQFYDRGSAEFEIAKQRGLIEALPSLPVASRREVEQAEGVVGRPFPDLLRRLYLEVGNGGFGPGYGLLGLEHGHRDGMQTATDIYRAWSHERPYLWPLCHWGCAIFSFVDCSNDSGMVWGYDPNPVPRDELDMAFFPQDLTLEQWLTRWLDRRLYQPCLTQDELTGRWRGATDDEIATWLSEMDSD